MSPRTRLPHALLAAFCLATGSARAVLADTVPAEPAAAAVAEAAFQTWLADFRREAAERGISQATLDATMTGLQPLERVLELDRRQPEFIDTFLDYLGKRVNDWRLKKGTEALAQQATLLAEVEARYGIPARYLAAFWGLETNYGNHMGDIPLVAALATLAYDARRPAFFRTQLFDALRILDRGEVAPADFAGSWAGAVGHMQFMPSTWLAYAVDGDGDGRIDLRNSLADALHSAANYLRRIGWRTDEEWGREVSLPAGFDPALAGLDRPRPVDDWARLGVRGADAAPLPDDARSAALLLPQGIGGPAFLAGPNFQVILRWNRSINYAIAVGHLADRLAGAPAIRTGGQADNRRLSREQVETLQGYLAALGYDPGTVDGLPGSRTRQAIRAYQKAAGLPADGHPSVSLLEHLREAVLRQEPTGDTRMAGEERPA